MKPAAKASSAKMKAEPASKAGEELLGDDRGERAVEVEVVPLEHAGSFCAAMRARSRHFSLRYSSSEVLVQLHSVAR